MRTFRHTRSSFATWLLCCVCTVQIPEAALAGDRRLRREIETSIWIDASIYYGLGLHREAIERARAGILLFPKQSGFYRLLGLAHQGLNRCRPAIESFQRYLHLDPKGAFAEEIRTELQLCSQKIQMTRSSRLELKVSESGALVQVDNKPAGRSPLGTVTLAPGEHSIKVEKPGFAPWEAAVQTHEGQTTSLSAVLRRRTAGALLTMAKPRLKPWRRRMPLDLVLVVDRGAALATRTTKQAIRSIAGKLRRTDRLGIIVYGSQPYLLSRLSFVRDRQAVAAALERLGAGASLEPAMRRARRMLERGQTRGRRSHALLLSDGSSSPARISRVVNRLAVDGHTLSTIGLGETVDGPLLEMIARRARGRFYAISDDDTQLSAAILRELSWLGR
jgi:hypothetical protein